MLRAKNNLFRQFNQTTLKMLRAITISHFEAKQLFNFFFHCSENLKPVLVASRDFWRRQSTTELKVFWVFKSV